MFTVATKDFKSAFEKCLKFVGKKSSLPVLNGVKVEYKDNFCTMLATNLDNYISVRIPGVGDKNVAFVFSDTPVINKSLKFFGDKISFDLDNVNTLIVTSGNKSIKQTAIDASEFPPMIDPLKFENVVSEKVNGKDMDNIYRKMKHCVSEDEARPVLQGIQFQSSMITGTDGFVACKFVNNIIDAKFNIPLAAIKNFNLFDDGVLFIGTVEDDYQYYYFASEDMTIAGNLIKGNFPDVTAVIPSMTRNHESYRINRKEMIDALNFTISMGCGRVVLDKNHITGHSSEDVETTITTDLPKREEEGNIVFSFNPSLLKDALVDQFNLEEVTLTVFAANFPFLVVDDNSDNGLFLCMPMRMG